MKPPKLPPIVVPILAAASCALGQEARIVTVTDAASPRPGMTVVSKYLGPLPPQGPARGAIPQMAGFPTSMGRAASFSPSRGLVFADLNGDGYLEIITSSTDNRIYAWDYTGTPMPGFPVNTIEMAQYAPSVADLDGDGDLEIVQFTRGVTSGGRLYVLDHMGSLLPGFPVSVNNNNLTSCPTLYDLDGDGVMEIIAGERDYPLGYLHVFRIDGSEWGGNWPVALDHVPTVSAVVGDVDADGDVEIFYMSYDSMYLLELDETILPGWPMQIANAQFSYQSAALADLDGDADLEIVVGAHGNAPGCYVYHHDGTGYPGWPKLFGTWSYGPPTVTDLEGDGELEIIDGRAGVPGDPNSSGFWVWTSSGVVKPGFPYVPSHGLGGGSDGPYTVADINGDGVMEIFADHNLTLVDDGNGFLFGVDAQGNDLPGFPLRPRGWTYLNGATIGDVDGDGDYELGVLSYHDSGVDVNLYDLVDLYSNTVRDWKVYHARNRRGGLFRPCPGDLDGDGEADLDDYAMFAACMSGPGVTTPPVDCPQAQFNAADIDTDGDVDLGDFSGLQATYCP